MNWFVVRLKMQSASGTLWQADTIFGHLCWALRYLEGEKALADFLEWYKEGLPPLLVSNGFPGELLPHPLLPPPAAPANLSLTEQFQHFRREKKAKKIAYLSPQDFARLLKGESIDPEDKEPPTKVRATLKNQISRLTGTTGEEGQLFSFAEHFWDTVTIYLKIEPDFWDTAKRLFDYLRDVGYGKRKSVGYGQIRSIAFEPFQGFDSPPDANGFVSLSNFVPAHNDPVKGSWRLVVKYGKLSEGYATEPNIFKKPLIMMEAGSTFYYDTPVKDTYGRMVTGLAKNHSEVVQYGFALPVAMKLPE